MATAMSNVSLIHPDLYNQVLRAHGIKGVRAVDRDARIIVRVDGGTNAVGELVSALASSHFALIAATSHANTMRDAREILRELRPCDRERRDDIVDRLQQSIDALTGLAPRSA